MRRKLIVIGMVAILTAGCRSTATSPSAAGADASSASPSSTPLAGSAPSGPGADAPSLAPGETYAIVFGGRRSVPAGEQVTQHLDFESTSVALVGVYGVSGTLSVRVGSAPLTETALGTGYSSWNMTLKAPADADLTISNLSASAVAVDAFVTLATKRVLTVSAPGTSTAGVALPVEVTLTEAVNGETPDAFLIDEAGTRTPIPLSAVGPGSWTGTIALPHGGSYRVSATVIGDRPRSAVALLTAAFGTAHLGETFEELLFGNEDGLADGLRLTVPVTTAADGKVELIGDLVDSAGAFIARAHTLTTPTAPGSVSIALDFDGEAINRSGRSGRYRLIDVKLFRADNGLMIEDQKADMGLTSASYDAAAFEGLTP